MDTSSTSSVDLSEWESITVWQEQWWGVVRQLEDLLALQALLSMRTEPNDNTVGGSGGKAETAEPITVSLKRVMDGGRGVMAEYVAKWIASQGILPAMLCLDQEPSQQQQQQQQPEQKLRRTDSVQSPLISRLQSVQRRLPHSLDSDLLMANCAWEYIVLWNKDPEVTFALNQGLAFLKCIHNPLLQHGVASMMWHMFLVKKLSSAAMLMEKVGKAPKDRLCRRDVGLTEQSMEQFVGVCVELLDTMLQSFHDNGETPMLKGEELWQGMSGASSLAELALEQKESNIELVEHHYYLSVMMHAVLHFSMKSCKPLSLFDTKGKNAFFKQLHTSPILPSRIVDEAILDERAKFMCRVIGQAALCLGDQSGVSPTPSPGSSPPRSPESLRRQRSLSTSSPSRTRSLRYSRWPPLMLRLAKDLAVDMDLLRRHHVCELYNGGHDKLAEEVLLTVNDHTLMGIQLMLIAGQRLHHFVFVCDPPDSVEKLAKSSPTISAWLKTACTDHLPCPNPPLSDTAALIGNVVNQLPEGHTEYHRAIELVDLVQAYL